MGKYRWYLLNCVIWCYLFDVIVALFKPIIFGATFIGYTRSFVPLSGIALTIVLSATIVTIINSGLSVAMALFFRHAQAYTGRYQDFFESRIYFVFATVHVACYLYFLGLMMPSRLSNRDELASYANEQLPLTLNFMQMNGIFAIRRTENARLFCLSLSVW